MFNIVLFEPEIPSNTGNIGRTCVVTGAHLHLIRPLGFELTDPLLKRAGMNYWHNLQVSEYDGWDDFLARNPAARLHLLTKRAHRTYAEATYRDGDFLVFGKESTGIAREVLAAHPEACERIPMLPDSASLDDAPAWHARHERLQQARTAAGNASEAGNVEGASGADGAGSASGRGSASDPGGPEEAAPAERRRDICGNFVEEGQTGISSLNLSNAVAIVLYEALRQTGFAGM